MPEAFWNVEDIARVRNRMRAGRNLPQVLDTIGIELESLALSRDRVSRILASLPMHVGTNFKVHRDGSSEINAFNVNIRDDRQAIDNIFVNAHTRAAESLLSSRFPKATLGYELISNPIDISTAEITLHALLPTLKNYGDFTSERCATHIHVGGMKNLHFLKNCLKLGLWADELFYSLAHMDGEKFRGYSNNAIYARPIMNGPFFSLGRSCYQVLNYEKALNAEDLFEFFSAYGINVDADEFPKYHPARYFSINLYSIIRIGTIEFRHFNQTFNPEIVTSIAKLCQMFTEIAIKAKQQHLKNLDVGDVFTLQSPSYYIHKIHKLIELSEELDCEYSLTANDVRILSMVIYGYNGIGIKNVNVHTHCRDFEVSSEMVRAGELKEATIKPIPDGHTDIHNIKYSSIIKE